MYQPPSTTLPNSTPKRAGQNIESISQEAMASTMEYSRGHPQDLKSLRSCSGNRAMMLLKGHLGIKFTANISWSSDSFSTVQPLVNGGDWGCIARDLETIIVLVLLAFNFVPKRSLTNLVEVTDQGLCYCNSNACLWHNNHQSGVIGIIDPISIDLGEVDKS